MRKYKRVFSQFTFHDRTGIQQHLESMALKGWMLDKITKWSWRFRRIEPKRIHFAVSYFAKTSSFQPEPPEELLRFREFCKHSGWVYCAEAAQMQIFYNEAEEPLPIETDAMLEIESIHRSIKKQLLPSYFILLAVAVINGWMRISDFIKYPESFLRSNLNLFVVLSFVCLFLMISVELVSYYVWRARALKRAEQDGSFLPTRGNRGFIMALLYILIAAFALLIIGEWNGYIGKAFLVSLGYYFALQLLVNGVSDIMKRKKVGAGTNITVTVVLSFVLAFAMVGVMSWTVMRLNDSGFFEEQVEEYVLAPEETYSLNGLTCTFYHHELPLYGEDLYDIDIDFGGEVYSNYRHIEESILLRYDDCESTVRKNLLETSFTDVYYTIVDVKASFLTSHILESRLSQYEHPRYDGEYWYKERVPELWQADEVYELRSKDWRNTPNNYIIRWGDRIVELSLKQPLTDEHIAIIAEKLGK